MNANPEKDFQRRFTGNITFYRELSLKRPPVFLRRSIAKFLHYHSYKRELSRRKADIPIKPKMSSSSEIGQPLKAAHQPSRSTWSIGEIFNKLEKGITGPDAPVLRIDLTGIRDRKAVFRNLPEQRPSLKRIRTTSVHAQCLLTIWATGFSKKEDLTYLVKQSKSCIIEAGIKESGERTATVTMESPFFVKYDELLITGRKPLNGYGNQMYEMQMAFLPANATDPWPPMDFLAPPPKIRQRMDPDGPVRFPMLLAQWRKLPQLPETTTESLLETWAYQDSKSYKTKLSLKLEAAWGAPSSQLSSYNATRRRVLSPVPHLPSPVSDHDTLSPTVSVTWIFQGLGEHLQPFEFDGYLCPMCQRRPSANMEAYHFHLMTGHDLFKFKVTGRATSVGTRQKVDVEVLVDVTDTFSVKASNNVLDERELNLQRPQTLFDLEEFLQKGNESWMGKENKSNNRLVPPRPNLGNTRSNSGDSAPTDIPIAVPSRVAEEVPDLPPPDRKKFAVPSAPPDIKFFRLTVKRPLQEGEYISESDDEMDESWLLQKHNDTIESFSDMSQSEKRFIQLYDRHMLNENFSSNLHFREVLIRFCRLNRDWLQGHDMNLEFHKNAARLLMQGLISPKLLRDCVRIIGTKRNIKSKVEIMDTSEDESQRTPQLAKRSRHKYFLKTASDSRSQDPVQKQTRSPTEAIHDYGRCCQCSSRIYNMQRSIRCSDGDCNAPDFHLECVGLTQRVPGWLCLLCEKSTHTFRNDTKHNPAAFYEPDERIPAVGTAKRHDIEDSGRQQQRAYGRQISSARGNASTATYVRESLTDFSREHKADVREEVSRKHTEAVASQIVRESPQNHRKEIPGSSQSSNAYALQGPTRDLPQLDGSDGIPLGENQGIEMSASDSDESPTDDSPEYRQTEDDDTGYEDVDDESSDQDRDLMMSEEERMLEEELDDEAPRTRFPKTRSAGSETMDEGP
ncbi:hypothetical protein MMC11_005553 [Xylographa trunciseda]|nr:hypothetical protein [Xylographa trunciseda]